MQAFQSITLPLQDLAAWKGTGANRLTAQQVKVLAAGRTNLVLTADQLALAAGRQLTSLKSTLRRYGL